MTKPTFKKQLAELWMVLSQPVEHRKGVIGPLGHAQRMCGDQEQIPVGRFTFKQSDCAGQRARMIIIGLKRTQSSNLCCQRRDRSARRWRGIVRNRKVGLCGHNALMCRQ